MMAVPKADSSIDERLSESQDSQKTVSKGNQQQPEHDFFVDPRADVGYDAIPAVLGQRQHFVLRNLSDRAEVKKDQLVQLSNRDKPDSKKNAFRKHSQLSFQFRPPWMPPHYVPADENSDDKQRQNHGFYAGTGKQITQPEVRSVSHLIRIAVAQKCDSAFVDEKPGKQKQQTWQRPSGFNPIIILSWLLRHLEFPSPRIEPGMLLVMSIVPHHQTQTGEDRAASAKNCHSMREAFRLCQSLQVALRSRQIVPIRQCERWRRIVSRCSAFSGCRSAGVLPSP